MMYQSTLGAVIGLASMAAAHMQMKSPPPLRSQYNEYTTDADYSMTSPLDQSGSNFPCKGYHSLVGTAQGKSVATWAPGSSQSMTITGGASHNGGSCQASLSYDKGSTWKVIHSYIGNCPVTGDSSYEFTVPSDAQSGEALFAWTWFNNVGNREMYMNCASITIGGSSKREEVQRDISSLPDMFVANVGNGCTTVESSDVEFPNPGSQVTNNSKKTSPPSGSCGGGGGSSSSSAAPTATAPQTSAVQSTAKPPASTTKSQVVSTPSASPTTLQTSTKSQAVTKTSAATNPTPTSGTPSSAFPQGQACTSEGEWNCVGGSQYQRCASGIWSALQAVYPGTTCTPGQSQELAVTRSIRGASGSRSFIEVVRSLWM